MSGDLEQTGKGPEFSGKIKEYIEEPIFALSVFVFMVSVLGAIVFGGNTEVLGEYSSFSLTYLSMLSGFIFVLALLSFFFIWAAYSRKEPVKKLFVVPLLIILTSTFFWNASQATGFVLRDNVVFALISSLFLMFYAAYTKGLLDLRVALVFALFFSSLILHLAPAADIEGAPTMGKYLSALDPYYFYRHADFIVENSYVPEKETLVYPTDPPSFASSKFMVSVLMGAVALIAGVFGFSTYDVAMVYPGVFAAFSVLLIYLLMRDLFADMKPYNYAAALLAAGMLALSPAFAIKAIATNCEDDALGMFLLIASFLLFALAYRKKSYLVAGLSGFSFLLLNLTWSGYLYGVAVFGVFACAYAFINLVNKKSCIGHMPYFVIPVFISQLHVFILHAKGALPLFALPSTVLLISMGAPIFVSVLFEALRVRFFGRIEPEGECIDSKVQKLLEQNIYPLAGAMLVLSLVFFIVVMDPGAILDFIIDSIQGTKIREIIGMTTAEQSPLCDGFDIFSPGTYSACTNTLIDSFGISIIFGMLMVLVLLYFAFVRNSMGAVFVLSWSLPMVWGVINKSQYQFIASVPIVALGATLGLVLALKKKDFEGLRTIGVIMLLILPVFFYFIQGGMFFFGPFGGESAMYRGIPGDIVRWDSTLQWLKAQPEDTVVLTWWDYGHWIAAVSQRTSIADNTKARRFVVQDLARFHVLEEDEDAALEIAGKYNATHVIIDYTMIAKSGAPHFIATSNLSAGYDDPDREGEHMAYSSCVFSPSQSSLDPEYVSDGEGGFDLQKTVVFTCSIGGDYTEYVGNLVFEITEDDLQLKVTPIVVKNGVLQAGRLVSWDAWREEHKASILGVQPLLTTQKDGDIIDGVLNNVLAYSENPQYYLNFEPYKTLVYVPEEFNPYMMTSLYLGEYQDQYKQLGLCDSSVKELEHFELEEGFRGSMRDYFEEGSDVSMMGYVRVYEIDYPED